MEVAVALVSDKAGRRIPQSSMAPGTLENPLVVPLAEFPFRPFPETSVIVVVGMPSMWKYIDGPSPSTTEG